VQEKRVVGTREERGKRGGKKRSGRTGSTGKERGGTEPRSEREGVTQGTKKKTEGGREWV
jgi:hypothetical protein